MNKWISIDDQLPDDDASVLIFDWNWQEICIGRYTTDVEGVMDWDTDDTSDRVVTHWMPLPEPPEEE